MDTLEGRVSRWLRATHVGNLDRVPGPASIWSMNQQMGTFSTSQNNNEKEEEEKKIKYTLVLYTENYRF